MREILFGVSPCVMAMLTGFARLVLNIQSPRHLPSIPPAKGHTQLLSVVISLEPIFFDEWKKIENVTSDCVRRCGSFRYPG